MKCLSIRQPWADLILKGKKKVEIRTWNTKFRGYFLVHASKTIDKAALNTYAKIHSLNPSELNQGCIIGYAKLVDVVVYNNKDDFLHDNSRHLSINANKDYPVYGFVLENVKKIKPIKYKGKLGFFDIPELRIENIKVI